MDKARILLFSPVLLPSESARFQSSAFAGESSPLTSWGPLRAASSATGPICYGREGASSWHQFSWPTTLCRSLELWLILLELCYRSCRQRTRTSLLKGEKKDLGFSKTCVSLNLLAVRSADIKQENHGSHLVAFSQSLPPYFPSSSCSSLASLRRLASSVRTPSHSVSSQSLVILHLLHVWYPSSSFHSRCKYPGSAPADSSCLQSLAFHIWATCCCQRSSSYTDLITVLTT